MKPTLTELIKEQIEGDEFLEQALSAEESAEPEVDLSKVASMDVSDDVDDFFTSIETAADQQSVTPEELEKLASDMSGALRVLSHVSVDVEVEPILSMDARAALGGGEANPATFNVEKNASLDSDTLARVKAKLRRTA